MIAELNNKETKGLETGVSWAVHQVAPQPVLDLWRRSFAEPASRCKSRSAGARAAIWPGPEVPGHIAVRFALQLELGRGNALFNEGLERRSGPADSGWAARAVAT